MNLLDALAPELWQLVLGDNTPGGTMTRAAKASNCLTCDTHLIHGLDGDQLALDAYTDAQPLSAFGEVQATVAGLRTYDLTRRAGGFLLDARGATHVRNRPAGSGVVDVLVEHRCGAVVGRASPVLRVHRPDLSTVPDF